MWIPCGLFLIRGLDIDHTFRLVPTVDFFLIENASIEKSMNTLMTNIARALFDIMAEVECPSSNSM